MTVESGVQTDHRCRCLNITHIWKPIEIYILPIKITTTISVAHFSGERLYQSGFQTNWVLTRYFEGKR